VVEWRDLNCRHVADRREAAPERDRKRHAAHRGLEIEAEQRHLRRHRLAMREDLALACALPSRERQQHRVVAEPPRGPRFAHRLLRPADRPGDQQRAAPSGDLGGDAQHRLVQPRVADGELRGVHPDGEAARARVQVVAGERPLPRRVQAPVRAQRQRVGRDDAAGRQPGPHALRPVLPAQTTHGAPLPGN
jgi:hypothetical protein